MSAAIQYLAMGIFSKIKSALAFNFVVEENAPPLSPQQERGLALGAVYAAEGYLPINALTMKADAATAAKVIRGAWGVTDAASAREAFAFLLGGGHDRVHRILGEVEGGWTATGSRKEQAAAYLAAIAEVAARHGEDPAELQAWATRWAARLYSGLPDALPKEVQETPPTSIVAWDAARVVHLSRLVVDAGFLSADETWSYIAQAVTMSAGAYSTWREFCDAFLFGRYFWQFALNGVVKDAANSDVRTFSYSADHLFEEEGSPWLTIPWAIS